MDRTNLKYGSVYKGAILGLSNLRIDISLLGMVFILSPASGLCNAFWKVSEIGAAWFKKKKKKKSYAPRAIFMGMWFPLVV
jgi:hypothetical protein